MDWFYLVFDVCKICLVIALVIFIIYNALKNKGKRIQSLVLMIFTGVLVAFFTCALIIDNYIFDANTRFYKDLVYYVLIGISLLFFVIFLVNFIKNRKFLAAKNIKKKMVYTYHTKIEHLYVFYRYANYIYLVKDTYAGINYKLKKMEFTDDAIKSINKSADILDDIDADRSGMITVKGQTLDHVYYCYKIDLESRLDNDMFVEVEAKDLATLPMQDFDRFVIYTSLMKNDFDEIY